MQSNEDLSQQKQTKKPQTSPAAQGLRLWASNAGGVGLIPDQGTNIPHDAWQKNEGKKKKSLCIHRTS